MIKKPFGRQQERKKMGGRLATMHLAKQTGARQR